MKRYVRALHACMFAHWMDYSAVLSLSLMKQIFWYLSQIHGTTDGESYYVRSTTMFASTESLRWLVAMPLESTKLIKFRWTHGWEISPSRYKPGSMLLDFNDHMRIGWYFPVDKPMCTRWSIRRFFSILRVLSSCLYCYYMWWHNYWK